MNLKEERDQNPFLPHLCSSKFTKLKVQTLKPSFSTTAARTAAARPAPATQSSFGCPLFFLIQESHLIPRAGRQSLVFVCSVVLLPSSVALRHHSLRLVVVLEVSNPPIAASSSSSASWSLPFVCSAAALPIHHCLRVVIVAWPSSPSRFCPSAQSAQKSERRFRILLVLLSCSDITRTTVTCFAPDNQLRNSFLTTLRVTKRGQETMAAMMQGVQKNTLYVGGLAEEVNESILHAAFIPFGDIKDVKTPLDQATQKHRSFGFVTFLEREDAAAAMDNMDGAELYGRVLTVNYALPEKIKGGEQGWAAQPIWADADTWFERQQQEEEMRRLEAESRAANQAAEDLRRKKAAEEREGEKEDEIDPMAKAEAEALQQNN
ncbi:hypothetical protein Ahy_A06g029867 isoform B [Arachis hypogaea]|uniref:RRM domain-containing protein n=3 Tax=Arachis TaxID=3817 RepID=A0A445CUG1_ARAHY|nr:hypothetical protein Ahy_A06g029867 isoform B [Arachis hypogaea]